MQFLGNGPTIVPAEMPEDFEAFGTVCRAYVDWCRERYSDMPWFVEEVFGYQALDEELKGLRQKYGQPVGRTMLAVGETALWQVGPTGVCPAPFANSSASMSRMRQEDLVSGESYRTR